MRHWLLPILVIVIAWDLDRSLAAEAKAEASFKTRPVRVRVIDSKGAPMEGASIHRSVWTPEKFPANADLATNQDGEVNFEAPEKVEILRLWAKKENHVPVFANFEAEALGGDPVPKEFTFKLSAGTRIGGYVVDEAGEPIAGVKVEVRLSFPFDDGTGKVTVSEWLAYGKAARETDERGFWSLNNMPADDYIKAEHLKILKVGLWLRHDDRVSDVAWRGLGEQPVFKLQDLRAQTLKTAMEKGVRVNGTITGADGKPIPKALVFWGDNPYPNLHDQEVYADDNGKYRLPPLSPGPTTLTVVAPGFAPELQTVDLAATNTVDFQLKAGNTVGFHFVDEKGKPIPEVGVNVLGWRGKKSLFNWRHSNVPYTKIPDRADKEGKYMWEWAPADPVEFRFTKEGFQSERKPAPGASTYRIVLYKEQKP